MSAMGIVNQNTRILQRSRVTYYFDWATALTQTPILFRVWSTLGSVAVPPTVTPT